MKKACKYLLTLGLLFSVFFCLAQEKAVETTAKEAKVKVVKPKAVVEKNTPTVTDKEVEFNFKNADIRSVVDFFAKLKGLVPIIDSQLTGEITVSSRGKKSRQEAFDTFLAVLNNLGYTVIRTDEFLKVILKKDAPHNPIKVCFGNDPKQVPDIDEMITQVIPCTYISAQDLLKHLEPLVSSSGNIFVDKKNNILIISDIASNVKRLLTLLSYLDVPKKKNMNEVTAVVYPVRYLVVKDLAASLRKVFAPQTAQYATTSDIEVSDMVIIEPIIAANAILVSARNDVQAAVKATITKLDVRKRQVLLEVKLLEAQYTKNFDIGTNIIYAAGRFKKNDGRADANAIHAGPFDNTDIGTSIFDAQTEPQFAYTYRNKNIDATVQTLLQHDSVRILSQPRLLTADNQKATLTVGTETPILKSTTQITTQVNPNTVSDYSYLDVGITMEITPHITKDRDVSLDIHIKVTNVLNDVIFPGGVRVPELAKRETTTNVTVLNQNTLIIGGILGRNRRETNSGMPFLSQIPIVGWLFGTESDSKEQTELIILITPRVIEEPAEGDTLTDEERARIILQEDDFMKYDKSIREKKNKGHIYDLKNLLKGD